LRSRSQQRAQCNRLLQFRAVPVVDVHRGFLERLHIAGQGHDLHRLHDVEHPSAHGARIHPQRAADVAGDAFEKFEADQPGRRRQSAQVLEPQPGADPHAAIGARLEGRPAFMRERDHQAVHAFVRARRDWSPDPA
jgi:hypothetical protein